jgi:hypothetical protein
MSKIKLHRGLAFTRPSIRGSPRINLQKIYYTGNDLAAPVARVGQRAVFEETLPALACMEELGKEDELAIA